MEKQDNNYTKYLKFIGAPFVLIVAPIIGYFIGFWLDRQFETRPYLSYAFLFLGIVAGIREFYNLIINLQDDDQSKS